MNMRVYVCMYIDMCIYRLMCITKISHMYRDHYVLYTRAQRACVKNLQIEKAGSVNGSFVAGTRVAQGPTCVLT